MLILLMIRDPVKLKSVSLYEFFFKLFYISGNTWSFNIQKCKILKDLEFFKCLLFFCKLFSKENRNFRGALYISWFPNNF